MELLTKDQVLLILEISKSYFDKKIKNKYLSPISKEGNFLLYNKTEVEDFKKDVQEIDDEYKTIQGFEKYKINKNGIIYSFHNLFPVKLNPRSDKDGYLEVSLYKNKKRYYKRVHRLVAETFIPNPNNLPVINHKDENVTNNNFENLEWCTVQYNCKYSSHKNTGSGNHKSIGVYAYKNNGEFVGYFESGNLCAKYFGLNENTIRSSYKNTTRKGKKGYYFRREKESD